MANPLRVQDILKQINSSAPFDLAESWDNVGLLVGDPQREVRKILVGLDPTTALVDEAVAKGADTIITHHPVIFRPLKSINSGEPEGRLLATALSHSIAMIGCHTNLDSARMGVSDILAERLGLSELTPLIGSGTDDGTGIGRIGKYSEPLDDETFIKQMLEALSLESVQIVGKVPETVSTVAVCGGSGSDFAPDALRAGADVYVSAEIKHATAIWAKERDFCIVDGTHYATEYPAVSLLVNQLSQWIEDTGRTVVVLKAESEAPPFSTLNSRRL